MVDYWSMTAPDYGSVKSENFIRTGTGEGGGFYQDMIPNKPYDIFPFLWFSGLSQRDPKIRKKKSPKMPWEGVSLSFVGIFFMRYM